MSHKKYFLNFVAWPQVLKQINRRWNDAEAANGPLAPSLHFKQ